MTEVKKLDELAEVGVGLIEIQLLLAGKQSVEALNDFWVLGYCFGVFDALAQRARLDQYTEGLELITLGFDRLMSDHLAGADKVKIVLDNQTDPYIAQGMQTGGSDLFAWFANTNKAPTALANHLTSQRTT